MFADEVILLVDAENSEDPCFVADVVTSDGTPQIMGELEIADSYLVVRGLHVGGDPAVHWQWSRLRAIGRAVVEKLDVNYIEIQGAVRTTGANPGRLPRLVRLARPDQSRLPDRREHP